MYDINDSFKFDDSIKPGPKSVLGMFTTDSMPILHKLYTKLYPTEISDSEVPFTFKKYSTVTWHGKQLNSNFNKSAKSTYMYASPPFQFTSSSLSEFEDKERLAKIDYFLVHSIKSSNNSDVKPHFLTCAKWPMIHPQCDKYGKPVQSWYNNLYEPQVVNRFILLTDISSRVIFCVEKDYVITVPVID